MSKTGIPSIRFRGFDDAWEQRKLGDVVKEITRNDPESEAPIMMITANNGFIEQSERYDLLQYNFTKTVVLGRKDEGLLTLDDFKEALVNTYNLYKTELLRYCRS